MKINKKVLEQLNPCANRLNNYLEHYDNKEFSVDQFLRLKKITLQDKIWVAVRLMPKKNLRFFAGEVAKSVLPVFEKKFPGDLRPRKAIEEALRPKLNRRAAAASANAAATSAAASAYAASAYAADTSAADAAASAYAASAYAASANAASAADAAVRAAYASPNKKAQQSLQLKIIRKYWR